MSTSTPTTDLQDAVTDLGILQTQLSGDDSVATSLSNAAKARTLKAAQASITTGQQRLAATASTQASILGYVQAALAGINPTPPLLHLRRAGSRPLATGHRLLI